MDQIIGVLENIDFNAIITWLTDLIAQINFQSILDEVMTIISGFIV